MAYMVISSMTCTSTLKMAVSSAPGNDRFRFAEQGNFPYAETRLFPVPDHCHGQSCEITGVVPKRKERRPHIPTTPRKEL